MSETIYLGGYTRRVNQGIATVQLDTATGQLSDYRLAVDMKSPTYLVRDGERAFSAVQEGELAGVATVDLTKGTVVATQLSPVAPPCHVYYDSKRRFVYASYYHQGLISVLRVADDGQLFETDRIAHTGSSVKPEQASAHVHYAGLTPDEQHVLVCDLGEDKVYVYTVTDSGKLLEQAVWQAPEGFGPRHLVCHPHLPLVYVFGELSSEVAVLSRDDQTGALTTQAIVSTIPESHTTFNGGAAIRLSSDARFLYASNRGHDSIVIFAVDASGQLSLVDYVPTQGRIPRDFNFNQTEDFLIVGHQDSDNLSVFARNRETGQLSLCQSDTVAPECVCVAQ